LSLYSLKEYENTINYFDRVLSIVPNHILALFNKGLTFGKLGLNDDSIQCYDKVLKVDQKHVLSLFHKGLTLFHLNKFNDAISCLPKRASNNPFLNNASKLSGTVFNALS